MLRGFSVQINSAVVKVCSFTRQEYIAFLPNPFLLIIFALRHFVIRYRKVLRWNFGLLKCISLSRSSKVNVFGSLFNASKYNSWSRIVMFSIVMCKAGSFLLLVIVTRSDVVVC